DLAGLEIDLLRAPLDDPDLQVERAALAEALDHRAGLRVQLDQLKPGRRVDDPFVALAVGPVRHPASRELARRDRGAAPFAQAVRPDHLAGLAVERDHRTAGAAGGVEDPLDRDRRPFELELGPRAEVVGLEAPRHLEG